MHVQLYAVILMHTLYTMCILIITRCALAKLVAIIFALTGSNWTSKMMNYYVEASNHDYLTNLDYLETRVIQK